MTAPDLKKKNKKVLLITGGIVAGMFGFAFALVPLYDVMCKQLGINGKTNTSAAVISPKGVDISRTVTVQFDVTYNEAIPWEFKPTIKVAKLHPGESIQTAYFARNTTDHGMTVQAIPSVTPGLAAQHIKKLECFCFSQQYLDGGHSAELPLTFILDPDIPSEINTVTLSYTLFDIS